MQFRGPVPHTHPSAPGHDNPPGSLGRSCPLATRRVD